MQFTVFVLGGGCLFKLYLELYSINILDTLVWVVTRRQGVDLCVSVEVLIDLITELL